MEIPPELNEFDQNQVQTVFDGRVVCTLRTDPYGWAVWIPFNPAYYHGALGALRWIEQTGYGYLMNDLRNRFDNLPNIQDPNELQREAEEVFAAIEKKLKEVRRYIGELEDVDIYNKLLLDNPDTDRKLQHVIERECREKYGDVRLPLGWSTWSKPGQELFADHFKRTMHPKGPGGPQPGSPDEVKERMKLQGLEGWRRFVTNEKMPGQPRRLFYYHLSSRTSQYYNPRLLDSRLFNSLVDKSAKLPEGWKVMQLEPVGNDSQLRKPTRLYINNDSRPKYTTFADPRAFSSKLEYFKVWRASNYQKNFQKIYIDWTNVLDVFIGQLCLWSIPELHALYYTVQYPENPKDPVRLGIAIDVEGLLKTMVAKTASAFVAKQANLFAKNSAGYCVFRAALSSMDYPDTEQPSALKLYYLFGRYLGFAMWSGQQTGEDVGLDVQFALLNQLEEFNVQLLVNLNKTVDDDDLKETLSNRLTRMNELINTYPHDFVDQAENMRRSTDWKPSEDFQAVWQMIMEYLSYEFSDAIYEDDNTVKTRLTYAPDPEPVIPETWRDRIKMFYDVQEFIERTIVGRIKPALNAIKNGFKDVVPLEWARLFTQKEFDSLLCGDDVGDFDEWGKHVRWEFIDDWDQAMCDDAKDLLWTKLMEIFKADGGKEQAKQFLMFVTGNPRPPPGGFAGYASIKGKPFTISFVRDMKDKDKDERPLICRAHTCGNQLEVNADKFEEYRKEILEGIYDKEEDGRRIYAQVLLGSTAPDANDEYNAA